MTVSSKESAGRARMQATKSFSIDNVPHPQGNMLDEAPVELIYQTLSVSLHTPGTS